MPRLLAISSYRDALNAVRPEGRWFVELATRFGYEIALMTRREGAAYLPELEAAGVRIIDWHPRGKFSREESRRVREELDRGGYDLLHLFNNKAISTGVRAARGWSGRVLTYRGYTGNVHWWNPLAYLQHLSPRVDRIVCVSPAVKEVFDRLPGFDSAKAVVVAKGHDPAWYAGVEPLDLTEVGVPAGKTVVVIVANARRMKGMDYLGTAIGRLAPGLGLHFLFVGRGLNTNALLADLADSPYHDDFTFAGFRSDVLRLVAAADVALLPSTKGEGLSKVLLESMFLGRPTIMTDIGGNRGLGVDGETALIVPAKDEAALRAALERLAEDADLRARLGPAGRAYVTAHFRASETAAELERVYRRTLGR